MSNYLNGHRSSNCHLIAELNELCRAVKATKECLQKFGKAAGSGKQQTASQYKKLMEVEKKIASSIAGAVHSIVLDSKKWRRKLAAALLKVFAEELTLFLLGLLRKLLPQRKQVPPLPSPKWEWPPPADPRAPDPKWRRAALRRPAMEQEITLALLRQWAAALLLGRALGVVLEITKKRLQAEREITDEMYRQLRARGTGLGLQLVSAFWGGFVAGGGPVRAGQMYLVGERGPELFRPAGSGTIIPNHQLRPALAGSGGNVFNFHIQSTDGPGVRQALSEAMPVLEQRAAAIAENRVGTALSRPSPLRGLARR